MLCSFIYLQCATRVLSSRAHTTRERPSRQNLDRIALLPPPTASRQNVGWGSSAPSMCKPMHASSLICVCRVPCDAVPSAACQAAHSHRLGEVSSLPAGLSVDPSPFR